MKKIAEFALYIVAILVCLYEISVQENTTIRSGAFFALFIFLMLLLHRTVTEMRNSRGGQSSPWGDNPSPQTAKDQYSQTKTSLLVELQKKVQANAKSVYIDRSGRKYSAADMLFEISEETEFGKEFIKTMIGKEAEKSNESTTFVD